jgi:hypothetical protein
MLEDRTGKILWKSCPREPLNQETERPVQKDALVDRTNLRSP